MGYWIIDSHDSFKRLIHSGIQQIDHFYKWAFESLVHTIRSKRGFIQKLNTAVLLRDAQQVCCGFLGIIFVGKIEQNAQYCV